MGQSEYEPDIHKEVRYTAPLVELLANFHIPTTIRYPSVHMEGTEYLIVKKTFQWINMLN